MHRRFGVHAARWPMKAPFVITGYVFDSLRSVVVTIEQDGMAGCGEGVPVYYLGEDADGLLAAVEAVRPAIEAGADHHEVVSSMPPGGARNAVDCAFWDLATKLSGQSIWDLTGETPTVQRTAFTLGIKPSPAMVGEAAAEAAGYSLLKIKLDGQAPVERVRAVREARPDATLVVDANQGFTFPQLQQIADPLAELGVEMIEQPLPRGADGALDGFTSPVPLCADESCLHRGDLPVVLDRYDMVNIKLDKTGGLTEALALADAAAAAGKALMVGNMLGTSLSMAPAFVVAQRCRYVDLDGPLNLKSDYPGGMVFEGDTIAMTDRLWGMPR